MRVLHLVDSLNIGGSESLAASLAGGFAKRGVDNIVCSLRGTGNLVSRLEHADIPYRSLGVDSGVSPVAMLKIADVLIRKRCDCLITHHFRQLLHASGAAFLLRRPIIHVEHDFHSYIHRPDILKKMGYCMPAVTKFIGVSDEITAWFSNRIAGGEGKIQTIHNGVDVSRFTASKTARQHIRELLKIPDKAIVVGTCARMEPVKDLELLVRGFKEMLSTLRKCTLEPIVIRLVCVGDGSSKEAIKKMATDLGVEGQCIFPGMVDNVEEYLASFDIYGLTSKDEGLPLSVMEAMSSKLPIVSTDVGSVSRLVDSTVGKLLLSRNPDEIGEAFAFLAKNHDTRRKCGKKARVKIKEMYSMGKTVNSYLEALGGMG